MCGELGTGIGACGTTFLDHFFFGFGFFFAWASADASAVFSSLGSPFLPSVLPAAEAALLPVAIVFSSALTIRRLSAIRRPRNCTEYGLRLDLVSI